jgi:hypothetical protein
MSNPLTADTEAWEIVQPEDLWVFDKLILSRRLGYLCGPKGTVAPPGKYIIRPCVNLLGMGRGASVVRLSGYTDHIPDGSFWCEYFSGQHLSVDYIDGKQVLCVEGVKELDSVTRWKCWRKVNKKPRLPKIIKELKNRYKYLNVEMINGKIIEVHLRLNPDFQGHNSPYVIPVYNEPIAPAEDQEFFWCPDEDRLGFYVEKE